MNTSEQLYQINDTLAYLSEKLDREIRLIKTMLRQVIDYVRPKESEEYNN